MYLTQKYIILTSDDISTAGNNRLDSYFFQEYDRSRHYFTAHGRIVAAHGAVAILYYGNHHSAPRLQFLKPQQRTPLYIDIEKRDLPRRHGADQHLALTRKQPSDAYFGELVRYAAGQILRYPVFAGLDLVEVLRTRQTDVTPEIVYGHVRPTYHALQALPIFIFICHINFFFASLHLRPRSSMDRI